MTVSGMTQWRPIFAQLLRPAVEAYYDMQSTVPVGDAPRAADFLLLRRTGRALPPFRGLWRNLTRWNILEYKGPSVDPRPGDVDLLVELGLGIDRRLRSRKPVRNQKPPPRAEVSFWYLANRLGRRFVDYATQVLGGLESAGPGFWRGQVLGRVVFLVSSVDLPVEVDSVPLHIVGREPLATEIEVARLVAERPLLQKHYGGWIATLHPAAWKEIEAMARTAKKELKIDLRPAIESLGLKRVLEQVGIERVVEAVGQAQLIEQLGSDRFVEQFGKETVRRMSLDQILDALTPEQRRQLKQRS
jgi:hypothetical protein